MEQANNHFVPDIHIRYGTVPRQLKDPTATGVLYQAKPHQFLLRLDEIGGFWMRNGKERV
ncbi:MAG: hypothetical protein D3911_16405 [Candidatus Electrothrix sp. AW3_4]|nr:hypothetical protein [Candidatus Electrothrix gigas]